MEFLKEATQDNHTELAWFFDYFLLNQRRNRLKPSFQAVFSYRRIYSTV